jgi:protein-S-isoprenylcysteine O-methyltransferase Ste14
MMSGILPRALGKNMNMLFVMKNDLRDPQHSRLNRGNLRDTVIVLAVISAFTYDIVGARMYASFLILGFGCFLHVVTKGVLNRNVVLCREGPYSIVRHPYYMANYLIDSSFCLLSGNVYLLLIYPFLFYWAYGSTIRKEESLLASIHGDRFLQYSLETPQIFPDPSSIRCWKTIFGGFSKQRITRNELSRFMRFLATAFFIMFIHAIKTQSFRDIEYFFRLRNHYRMEALLVVTVMLYVLSFIMQNHKSHDSVDDPGRHPESIPKGHNGR